MLARKQAFFPTPADPIHALADAWVLDLNADEGATWRNLDAANAPAGRRNGCGVVDPVTHALFVFGGTSDGARSEAGVFALDVEREAWTALVREHEPPVRSSAFGASVPGGGIVRDGQRCRGVSGPVLAEVSR